MIKKKSNNGFLVGIFIFIALIVLVVAVFTIGSKEGLFQETFKLSGYFNSVEGIRRGASVRLSGVDVGIVDDISIQPDNRVLLIFKINKDAQKYIRRNSEATIELEGVVGGKYISLSPGTNDNETVGNAEVIKTRDPFSMGKILQSAQNAVDNTQKFTDNLSAILKKVNAGKGTLGKLVNDESMFYVLLNASQYIDTTVRRAASQLEKMSKGYLDLTNSIDRIVSGVDTTVANINNIINKVKYGEGTVWALFTRKDVYDSLLTMIKYSVETVREAKSGASRFSENMEALKHNFFFKGYFEDRGYWDKVDFEKEIDQKLQFLKDKEKELEKREKDLTDKGKEIKNVIK